MLKVRALNLSVPPNLKHVFSGIDLHHLLRPLWVMHWVSSRSILTYLHTVLTFGDEVRFLQCDALWRDT